MLDDFEHLVHEAQQASFSGWDFSFLHQRMIEDPLPWDYLHRARELIPSASAMLDLCTGGGERLADLAPLPRLTVATESYRPNVPIAFCRLRKVRAAVIHVDEEVQNSFGPSSEKDHQHPTRRLPLADASFDLIVCRHGSYSSGEVARLLRPGGLFLSQLVGEDNYPHLNARLGGIGTVWIPPGSPPPPTLEQHGLQVLERQEARPKSIFKDIGAIVYYLKAVPWQIADFSVEAYMNPLRELHKQMRDSGGLQTHYHRRLLLARKPV